MENISKIVKKVEGGYKVKQATKKGYEIANEGDCVDLSYPTSKTRRGRVQHEIAQTITCNSDLWVVVEERKHE
jgi:DNA (cytosine-5)-methyltransferase 1